MKLFSLFKVLHIISGFFALCLFWIPLITKKGGKTHTRVGWLFVWAMGIVSISAFYMGIYRIFFDQNANFEQISFSIFLVFISLLSGATAWYGIRVLRFKYRKVPHRNMVDIMIPCILVCFSVAIIVYGFVISFPLLRYFPLVGIFLGGIQLTYWLKKSVKQKHWLYEHFSGMIACSISAVTAFTVFGAPRLLHISSTHLLLWLLPTLLLVPVIIGFTIYYEKKFR